MSAERLAFDTNILIYAYLADQAKQRRAADLIEGGGIISVQALNEFSSVARRKLAFSWSDVRDASADFTSMLDVKPLTLASHDAAIMIGEATGYTIYDCLMLAVASEAGATAFISEDLQHGRRIEGMEIQNPFL